MNVGRKILEKLEQIVPCQFCDTENVLDLLDLFREWIEWHEKMFDHSKYKDKYKYREKIKKEWLAFHDKILKE